MKAPNDNVSKQGYDGTPNFSWVEKLLGMCYLDQRTRVRKYCININDKWTLSTEGKKNFFFFISGPLKAWWKGIGT